jgi:hypothetical protein
MPERMDRDIAFLDAGLPLGLTESALKPNGACWARQGRSAGLGHGRIGLSGLVAAPTACPTVPDSETLPRSGLLELSLGGGRGETSQSYLLRFCPAPLELAFGCCGCNSSASEPEDERSWRNHGDDACGTGFPP